MRYAHLVTFYQKEGNKTSMFVIETWWKTIRAGTWNKFTEKKFGGRKDWIVQNILTLKV